MTNPQEDRQNNSATGLLLLALIAGLGLGLRLWQLTRLSFWSDECLTLAITRLSPMQLLEIILTTDVHPPGHYYVIALWQRISSNEFFVRLLPVLCGTASIPLIYAVAKRLLSRTVGLWAAFLLAVSPLHVVQSQQIRYPVMLTMLGLAMIYFVIRSMESDRQRYAVAAGLIGTAMLYTNYFALGLIGALGIVALIHTLRSSQRKAAALSGPVLCFVLGIAFLGVFVAKFVWGFHMAVGLAVMFVAYAALLAVPWPGSWSRPLMGPSLALMLFIPWVPVMLLMTARIASAYHYPFAKTLFHTLLSFTFSTGIYGMPRGDANAEVLQFLGLTGRPWLTVLFVLPACLLFLAGLWWRGSAGSRRWVLYTLLIVATGFSLFVCSRTRLYQPKYVMPSLPLFLMVVAMGLDRLTRWRKPAAVLLVLLVVGFGARSLGLYYTRPLYNQEHYREIGRYLQTNLGERDAVLFYHWIAQQCTCYYMGGEPAGSYVVPTEQQVEYFCSGRDSARGVMMLAKSGTGPQRMLGSAVWAAGRVRKHRGQQIHSDLISKAGAVTMLMAMPDRYDRLWVLDTYVQKRDPYGLVDQVLEREYEQVPTSGVSQWAREGLKLYDLHSPGSGWDEPD